MKAAISVALATAALGFVATEAEGAFISELFIDDDGVRGVPHAVEFDGLHRLEADHAELLVVDARPDGLGHLHRVITVPTDHPLGLLSERAWPEGLWGRDTDINALTGHSTLEELDGPDDFHFERARTLLLYDRPTGLEATLDASVFSESVQAELADAALLEALTLTFAGAVAAPEAPGPLVAVEAGDAIVRPLDEWGGPRSELVWGAMTAAGTLAGTDPALSLSPGVPNPSWEPIPEPGTAAVVLTMVALLTARRGGRCSHRRLGL